MLINRLVPFLSALIFASVFFEACSNKGCTDKNAVNYNVVADKDDHSCVFCDSTLTQTGKDSVFLTDYNSSGGHYGEVVAKFVVTQKTLKHNYASCGDDKCTITYTVENLCDQDFDLDYELQFSGNDLFFTAFDSITLATSHTTSPLGIPVSVNSNPCGHLSFGSLSVFLNSTIVYH